MHCNPRDPPPKTCDRLSGDGDVVVIAAMGSVSCDRGCGGRWAVGGERCVGGSEALGVQ